MNVFAARLATGTFLALALLLPVVYVPGVYDFTRWPRLLLLQIGVGLLGVAWLCRSETKFRQPKILLPIAAFTGWQIFTTLWAANPVESVVRGSQAVTMAGFSVACTFLLSRSGIERVIRATAAVAAVVSFVCICQYWGLAFQWIPTAGNPSATFGYRNYLATYLVTVLPAICVLAWSSTHPRIRQVLWLTAVMAVTALLCTRTRGAWLAAIAILALGMVALIVQGHLSVFRTRLSTRTIIPVLASISFIGLVGLRSPDLRQGGQFQIDEHKAEALTALKTSFSVDASRGRTAVWGNTFNMIADHPLVGVGLGGWQFAYPLYDRGDQITTNVSPQRPHNDLLWLLAETGIVGLLLYGWLLLTVVQRVLVTRPEHTPIVIGLALGITGYLVHSCFSYPLERIAASSFVWFSIGAISSLSSEGEHRSKQSWSRFLPLPLVGVGVLSAVLTTERIRFDWHYAKAVEAWRRSDWSSVVQTAEAALAVGPLDFRAYQLLGAGYQQIGQADRALAAYSASMTYHPNEGHRPLGDLLVQMGRPAEAVDHYRREVDLYPDALDTRVSLVRALGAAEDWAGMRQAASEILKRKPDHTEAISLMAHACEKQGDRVKAASLLEPLLASGRAPAAVYSQYASILSGGGKWRAALPAYRRAAELSPENPSTRNNLGVALRKLHRYSEAAEAFRAAISIDTSYARAYRNLGEVLEKMDEPGKAEIAYQAFIDHWQGDPAHRVWAETRIRTIRNRP